jgi:hypothetical protein
MSLFAAVLALLGCGDDGAQQLADLATSGDDLSVADDLSVGRDIAMPYDLVRDWSFSFADGSGLCASDGTDAGNGIAGTCAQPFFQKLADCWVTAGACYYYLSMHYNEFCWDDGAALQEYRTNGDLPSLPPSYLDYVRGTFICMTLHRPQGGTTETWKAYDGSTLTVVPSTGDVTCPDGSAANIGPGYGNCDELNRLINGTASTQCTFVNYDDPRCPPWVSPP